MASRLSYKQQLQTILAVGRATAIAFCAVCIYRGDEKFYESVIMPLTRLFKPEDAHRLAVVAVKWGLLRGGGKEDSSKFQSNVWGMKFKNPLGMAAGFDKHGEAVEGLHKMGFSFVEIGSVTPEPQPGNPTPRVFRLIEDYAIINRYGFNSEGHEVVWRRLKDLKDKEKFTGIIGVNLGKNKDSNDVAEDYVKGIKKFHDVADYFVINVSSPNTPGLRSLQSKENLEKLLTQVNETRQELETTQPLLLKLSPDLSETERQDIADVVLSKKSKVDGLVLCNTTTQRKNLESQHRNESGGLSGAPLTDVSTAMIADMYKRTHGSIPIIGVGGVFTGQDVVKKIRAGASLVQLYTSYAYYGPPIVSKIKTELESILDENKVSCVADIVGKDVSLQLNAK